MVKTITKMPDIFAVMKHGLRGYEGEKKAWKIKNVRFFHILARIKAEMELALEDGFPYYPYLTTSRSISNLDLVTQKTKAIDVFFTPIKRERHHWLINYPDLGQLKGDCDDKFRHTKIVFSDGSSEHIPCPIQMGDGSKNIYKVFLMKDLELFTWEERQVLDFSDRTYRNISTDTIINRSLRGSLSFGIFRSIEDDNQKSKGYQIEVVARAKIVPPYRATAYK